MRDWFRRLMMGRYGVDQLTWVLLVFMIFNSFMSAAAVGRWAERREQLPPSNVLEQYMDDHYPDVRMEKIYANMKW